MGEKENKMNKKKLIHFIDEERDRIENQTFFSSQAYKKKEDTLRYLNNIKTQITENDDFSIFKKIGIEGVQEEINNKLK